MVSSTALVCTLLCTHCISTGVAQTINTTIMTTTKLTTTTMTTTAMTTSIPSTIPPDPRCTPQSLRVRISDDEQVGCLHPYPLNISCTNWIPREYRVFSIERWMYSNLIMLETSYSSRPVVCVHGVGGELKNQFNNYTTTLLVREAQSQTTANRIPLTFEIVEMNDPPRISSPTDIYVVENDSQVRKWNITYNDPDDPKDYRSNYSITSPDMPEQLQINTTNKEMNGTIIQEFNLWQVKPFDADMFPGETLGPQRGYPEMFSKRSTNEKRYTKRRQSSKENRKGKVQELKRIQRANDVFPWVNKGDFLPGPIINFTLKITDQTGSSSEFIVRVNISDINDEEPVCKRPRTVALSRYAETQQYPVFELRTICSDRDFNHQNQISDYRLSNMHDCRGAFSVDRSGSLYVKDPLLLKNKSSCEFDIVAMDPLYATSVHLKLTYGECEPSVDARGVLWNTSQPGETNYMPCPQGYTGRGVTRFCNNYAMYDPAVYDCTSEAITNISRKMDDLFYDRASNLSMTAVLYELKDATDKTLMAGDISSVIDTLISAINIVKYKNNREPNKTDAFLDVANNLLKDDRSETWTSIMYQSDTGAEMVIDSVDKFLKAEVLADQQSLTKPQQYAKDNLMASVGSMSSCSSNMAFPNKADVNVPDWVKQSDNGVHLQCLSAGKGNFFSGTFYRNISTLVSPRIFNKSLENDTLNSAVISFSLFPDQPKKLDPPVEVTYDIINKTLKDPKCSYWKTEASEHGYWATDGCTLKSYKNGIVTCLCDHLTNFAVLMSPADPAAINVQHTEALSIISLVGCLISMVCLVATVVIYIVYWRVIKSERSMILLNLCTTLFIAYLVFLVGVNRTENKVGCTVVAVLLHFIYLAVFLLMLVQGINLALAVLKPLRKQRFGWQMTLVAYATSAVIVAMSMGATELNGYGNEKFCWLSVDAGLIWAFVVPVLFVIFVNSVITVIVLRGLFGTAAMKKKTDKEKKRTGAQSLLILMPVMGITWIFGIFAVNRETVVFQYLFAIFNSIQGLLIFIFHCVRNKKIREAFEKTRAHLFVSETVSTEGERMQMTSATNVK